MSGQKTVTAAKLVINDNMDLSQELQRATAPSNLWPVSCEIRNGCKVIVAAIARGNWRGEELIMSGRLVLKKY